MMVRCFRWKATRQISPLSGDDPQSIVLNGGVLDLSDFSTGQSGTSYNDGLEVSGSSGTVIGSQDVVDLAGGNDMHIGGDGKDGVYVVVDAGDGQVSLANNNSYLGTTQIASGTLMVSDNSQLGDTHYNRQVIFTDKQQESVMEITANVDTRSTTTEHGRDIEMRADGEVAVDAGVDTQWGALMADSSGQHQDEGSTFTKNGGGYAGADRQRYNAVGSKCRRRHPERRCCGYLSLCFVTVGR